MSVLSFICLLLLKLDLWKEMGWQNPDLATDFRFIFVSGAVSKRIIMLCHLDRDTSFVC
jgi:hypothetical protein